MTFTERQGKFSLLNLWLVKCGTVVVWFLKFEHETGSPFTTLPGALPNLSFPFFSASSQCLPPGRPPVEHLVECLTRHHRLVGIDTALATIFLQFLHSHKGKYYNQGE